MSRLASFALAAALLLATACDSAPPTGTDPSATDPSATDPTATSSSPDAMGAKAPWSHHLAFGPDAHPYGRSLTAWSKDWWRWELSIPTERNPSLDTTGEDCDEGQQGKVWYLGSIFGSGEITRTCTIPRHKALFINLSGILNDYPCPDPNFQPAPGQSLEDFLTEGVRAVVELVNSLTLTVDGRTVGRLFDRRYTSRLFIFKGDPSLKTSIDGCITGDRQPAVSDGYYVMLKPLSRGTHTVVFTATDTRGTATSVTYNLTIGRSGDRD